jgi:hypothetical protein
MNYGLLATAFSNFLTDNITLSIDVRNRKNPTGAARHFYVCNLLLNDIPTCGPISSFSAELMAPNRRIK